MDRNIRIFSPRERPVIVISPQECIRILCQSGIDRNHAKQIIQSQEASKISYRKLKKEEQP